MEVWYTDKKKGICHGEVQDTKRDYCDRRFFQVNGKWLQEDQLFRSEKELKEHLDSYIRNAHWDDYRRMGDVMSGYCTFRSSGKRDWL